MSFSRLMFAAAVVALAVAGSAVAQKRDDLPSSDQNRLTAIGTGTVKVKRPERLSNETIARAVDQARDKLAPEALRIARIEAVRLGYAANLTVGGLVAVNDVAPSPYGGFGPPFGGPGIEGTFGPGEYCGTVPSRRDRPERRRTCHVPPFVTRTVAATYAVTPK